MSQTAVDDRYFQTERVWKILLRIAPPVMLAQLIQALYNIVDSYFVGQYSNSGLTALSVILPVQKIITFGDASVRTSSAPKIFSLQFFKYI